MMFWFTATVIALLAAAPIALAAARARNVRSVTDSKAEVEMRVYRDQLAEVERDLARGVLSEDDAKRTRIEVSRRLLEADRARDDGATRAARPSLAVGVAAALVCVIGALALYRTLGLPDYPDLPLQTRLANAAEIRANRPSQELAEAEALAAGTIAPPLRQADPEHSELLEKLRAALAERPDDVRGLELLARNEFIAGNYKAAHQAQQQLIAAKGEAATSRDYSDLADMLIIAAGGFVSPEAETALTRALQRDDQNGTALYYSGLMFAQTGRPDMTFQLWEPLLSNSDPDAPWVAPIRAQIAGVAQAAGIRYTLPPEGADMRGPSAEDIANAADMSAEDRTAMIEGMVEGLAARLANEGGTPTEWARLISSLAMLGDTSRARAIWGEAQVMFGADAGALAIVREAAEAAGLLQ